MRYALASIATLALISTGCPGGGGGGSDTGFSQGDAVTGSRDTGATGGSDVTVGGSDTFSPQRDTTGTNPPQDTVTNPPQDTVTNPPQDTVTNPPQDTVVAPGGNAVGSPCSQDDQCSGGVNAVCITEFPNGYCTQACTDGSCPTGTDCWSLGDPGSFCLEPCSLDSECRENEGYECDSYNTCWPKPAAPTDGSPVGGPCQTGADCADAGASCLTDTGFGFFEGYCVINDCTSGSCPAGSVCDAIYQGGGTACVPSCGATTDCNGGYTCYNPGICFPGCANSPCPGNFACDPTDDICVPACTAGSCGAGLHCWPDGTCGDPPCTAGSCGQGLVCATATGECVPDLVGGPGPGPGPTCNNIPARDCAGTVAQCQTWSQFSPAEGPGYVNYPLNGETWQNQYRSFARADMQQLIKWAAATVDCKAAAWGGGNGFPLGLGDMSEANGAIPGTSVNSPGHPLNTHENGSDMDIAYYQQDPPNNYLRAICPYTEGGVNQYHCTGEPDNFDFWRTTYFIGLLHTSPVLRVIGVDGVIGPDIEAGIEVLCGQGWLPATGAPCNGQTRLGYEVVLPPDMNDWQYWFHHHHHHLHVSLITYATGGPQLPGNELCKIPGCPTLSQEELQSHHHGLETKTLVPLQRDLLKASKTKVPPGQ